MKRTASAVWLGNLKQGNGTVSTGNGALTNTPYSFSSRFEEGPGTNPEELIAAAHAGCFTMATTAALTKEGFTADRLATDAVLSLEQVDGAWTITKVHLSLVAKGPGLSEAKFQETAAGPKANLKSFLETAL